MPETTPSPPQGEESDPIRPTLQDKCCQNVTLTTGAPVARQIAPVERFEVVRPEELRSQGGGGGLRLRKRAGGAFATLDARSAMRAGPGCVEDAVSQDRVGWTST